MEISDEYTLWAEKSLQLESNSLMVFFFNKVNIDYLLSRMVSEVFRIKKTSIKKQSIDELLVIMRNHYIYAISGWTDSCSLKEKLKSLNQSVLQECVKQILSGIDSYKQYYKDASSIPIPLEHPRQTSMKGSRVLSERVGLQDNPIAYSNSVNSFNERYNIL